MSNKNNKLKIDFLAGNVAHRLKYGGGKGQALAKAIDMKTDKNPNIIDATAGLGRDSFLLASLGAKVIMIERSKKVHDLLFQAMQEAISHGGKIANIINNMQLIYGDAKEILSTLSPEIILIDPMHPIRKKSALVKQQMRNLRDIVGADEDAKDLIFVALKTASKRVVLKWPQNAKLPEGIIKPSHQIIGKTTRFDVFMI